ncbi:hypothetical protein FA13DRAFT_1775255 [Coprinellus micaceus]|uniref:CHAT domain-containing protein n=1 Tax=Coprinellus micaceus TaxID=71717 RepID=A0A4Y7T659_COPMI|nr:hypothetical protein FA13DRAFT_1775255 [Coprinellus micaceus]
MSTAKGHKAADETRISARGSEQSAAEHEEDNSAATFTVSAPKYRTRKRSPRSSHDMAELDLSKGPSGASGSGESGSSRLCLANIIFKSSEEGIEGGPAVHITEMWIPGLGGGDTENRYSVSKICSRYWRVDGYVELPRQGHRVECVLKGESGEEVEAVHLGCAQPGEKELSLSQEPGKSIEAIQFWDVVTIPFDLVTQPMGLLPDDLVLALSMINYTEPESMGRLSDLSEATCTLQRAVDLTCDDDPSYPNRLCELGSLLCYRFALMCDVEDIADAISFQEKSVQLTPEHHTCLPDRLYALAESCHYCYKRTGNLGDLDESISAVRRAVELCPGSHVGLPGFYAKLGELLSHLFEHSGQPEYLSKAISARERSVELAPEGHESLPNWLSDLGGSFESRFNISEDLEDIEEAISIRRRALKYAPADHPDRPWYLGDLGLSLYRRFQRSGVLEDITEAVSLQRQAVDLIPEGHTNLAFLLDSLGICLRSRFDRTGDLEDITEAVSSQRKAVNMTPEDHPDLPTYLNNLSLCLLPRLSRSVEQWTSPRNWTQNYPRTSAASLYSLRLQFEKTEKLGDIAEAILVQRRVTDFTTDRGTKLPMDLNNLSLCLRLRFESTGDLEDIAQAVSVQRKAVSLTSEDHPSLPFFLNSLSHCLYSQFEYTSDLNDIAEAVTFQRRAVDLVSEDQPHLPSFLDNLTLYLRSRFEKTGNHGDITEAVLSQHRAVDLTSDQDTKLPTYLNNLSLSLRLRFEHTQTGQNLGDITEAISLQRKAICLSSEARPDLPFFLGVLCLHSEFEHTGELEKIVEAASIQRRAINLVSDDHPHLPFFLDNLSLCLRSQFERNRSLDGITEAISLQRRVVDLTSEEKHRTNTGDLQDITEAILLQRRVVDRTPEGDPSFPVVLHTLNNCLHARFHHTGDLQDITEAISIHRRVMHLIPKDDTSARLRIRTLAIPIYYRFQHTGNLEDITEAIAEQRRTVYLIPESHARLPACLHTLGLFLCRRFEETGDFEDLVEAISAQRKALKLTPERHATIPLWINNLSGSVYYMFQKAGDPRDIDEAISLQRRALDLLPDGHIGIPRQLSNLGLFVLSRSEYAGDVGDLTEAISTQQRALDLTAEGHADLPRYLDNIGNLLHRRFIHSAKVQDLGHAISAQQRALHLTPEGHAGLPSRVTNLADSISARYQVTGNAQDLDTCISSYRTAATSSFGAPRITLRAALKWARLLNQHYPQSPQLTSAFDIALNAAALISGLEQTIKSRYLLLQEHSSLPLEAATIAFRHQRPDKALEWLEQGRCLVWGQINTLRLPMEDLRLHDSALAERLTAVAMKLDHAASSSRRPRLDMDSSDKISLENDARNHIRLAREWDELLAKVRGAPGFKEFLRPLGCSTIMEYLPVSGAVVVINVHDGRCDAIALAAGSNAPIHIQLPNFTLQKAKRYRTILNIQLSSHGLRFRGEGATTEDGACASGRVAGPYRRVKVAEDGVCMLLHGLWEEVVKPILEAVGFFNLKESNSSGGVLPRIWWCPTGPLSFLPLHAAGIYRGIQMESISDYVVSSYIPSVTALTQRVKNDHQIGEGVSGLFLTAQPKAPGAVTIPGTTKEVASIYAKATAYGLRVVKQEGDAVSADECLEFMDQFSSIHLACHASQNAAEPLQSQFRFHKGSLDLATIMRKNLKNADLAFLSACQTSTGEETLSDEAVHLASGMLAAGYRRVVATMWQIKDSHAPGVADDFYEYLWTHRAEGSSSQFDGTMSAHALHHAIEQLRGRLNDSDQSLLAWIPYVHFGY